MNTVDIGRGDCRLDPLALTIASHLDAIASDRSLRVRANLRARSAALDRLETLLSGDVPTVPGARAAAVRDELEAIDAALYASLRAEILAGNGAAALRPYVDDTDADDADGYDWRDDLVSGVFPLDVPAATARIVDPDSVFYQPTPARHVFALLRRVALTESDVLVDLGSGLGHVPLVAAACTPARCVGIEVEASYIDCAVQCASALRLANAAFVHADARDADFSTGTVFYLYTPFGGAMLRTVLDRLRDEAQRRAIRVASYGPCTATLAHERWLEPVGEIVTTRVAVFRSAAVPQRR